MTVTVYHNPRCSKSRETLKVLEDSGIEFNIRHYLEDVPSAAEIKQLVQWLGFESARDLMRTKEIIYKEQNIASITEEDELIEAMVNHPKLIERPIVVVDHKAAKIGRPPESVLTLF